MRDESDHAEPSCSQEVDVRQIEDYLGLPTVDQGAEQSTERRASQHVDLADGFDDNLAARVAKCQVEGDVIAGPPSIDSSWPRHGAGLSNLRPMIDREPSLSKAAPCYSRVVPNERHTASTLLDCERR
jgi:hypothetical protein